MLQVADSSSVEGRVEHAYSIIRAVLDARRGETRPVGVAVWDTPRQWYAIRVLQAEERVGGISPSRQIQASLVDTQVSKWASEGRVPYAGAGHQPWRTDFWEAVRRAMTSGTQFDEPRPMEPLRVPDDEVESLFEAIVQPAIKPERRIQRIDGAVTRALGSLAKRVPRNAVVAAYHGATETVLRGLSGRSGLLVVEGVNLAGSGAKDDADALASRMMRIEAAHTSGTLDVVVGYTCSPGGLNGEAYMMEWLRERITPHVYDLASEEERIRESVSTAVGRLSQT